jgi:hypothetical protein
MRHNDDMLPTLRALGDNLRVAVRRDLLAERAMRRRRTRSRVVVAVAGLGLLGAGAAGAASLIGVGEPLPDRSLLHRVAPRPADPAVFAVQARDPAGGLPWAVRIYRSDRGADCASAGRRRGQQLGFVQDGRFRALPAAAGGAACGNLAQTPLLYTAVRAPETPPYTLVFGRVRPGVRTVTIRGTGRARVVPVSRGAFLAIYRGVVRDHELRLRSARAGG